MESIFFNLIKNETLNDLSMYFIKNFEHVIIDIIKSGTYRVFVLLYNQGSYEIFKILFEMIPNK